jgi:hypothetical protein
VAVLATRTEGQVGHVLSADEIFEISRARERSLSRLLILYITTGLAFMLLPGTFLGVWNLLAISGHRAADSVSAGWVQAHGHAQIFGWIGTFILGIGFYSIPKLRRMNPFALRAAWTCWVLWTVGISLRWLAGIYQWQWRAVLPFSAVLELTAFLIFFSSVSGHRPKDAGKKSLEKWVLVVIPHPSACLPRWWSISARHYFWPCAAPPPTYLPHSTSVSWCSKRGASWFRLCGVSVPGGCRFFWDCAQLASHGFSGHWEQTRSAC